MPLDKYGLQRFGRNTDLGPVVLGFPHSIFCILRLGRYVHGYGVPASSAEWVYQASLYVHARVHTDIPTRDPQCLGRVRAETVAAGVVAKTVGRGLLLRAAISARPVCVAVMARRRYIRYRGTTDP